LKLGKEEPTSSNDDSSDTVLKTTKVLQSPPIEAQKEKRPEPERKIIRFDTPEKPASAKAESNPNTTNITSAKNLGVSADTAREELEQRRAILQNMKDFDFQIKKNQEEITSISNKVESLSKDLDDLVSLYEIVSEQMNPFVGLSKVTKKRLDALENIIREVDGVKAKLGNLETMFDNNPQRKTRETSTLTKPAAELKNKPETSSLPTTPMDVPLKQPEGVQLAGTEQITETEIDDLLNRSLESLLLEQNIDTVINDFFINLK
jgi:archaellum component FlaC